MLQPVQLHASGWKTKRKWGGLPFGVTDSGVYLGALGYCLELARVRAGRLDDDNIAYPD